MYYPVRSMMVAHTTIIFMRYMTLRGGKVELFISMKIYGQNVHPGDERFCNMCIVAVNKFLIT